jgi:glycosyltransferase involved in cell wall biosynthesis
VGGTNPSLLEAMSSKALIAAHNNPFNKSILQEDAFYFSDASDVRRIIETTQRGEHEEKMIDNNLLKINTQFNWQKIITQYEQMLIHCYYRSERLSSSSNEDSGYLSVKNYKPFA